MKTRLIRIYCIRIDIRIRSKVASLLDYFIECSSKTEIKGLNTYNIIRAELSVTLLASVY